MRVYACVRDFCPSQRPSITTHCENYILGLSLCLLLMQCSLFVKQGFVVGGRSLKCFVARTGNVAFGNLRLNPAQQTNHLPRVVVIEDSLKGCLCVIHPYVL